MERAANPQNGRFLHDCRTINSIEIEIYIPVYLMVLLLVVGL